jgi:hypothetical protein
MRSGVTLQLKKANLENKRCRCSLRYLKLNVTAVGYRRSAYQQGSAWILPLAFIHSRNRLRGIVRVGMEVSTADVTCLGNREVPWQA